MSEEKTIRIPFHFSPLINKNGNNCVTKNDEGKKRKYLEGVSSGVKIDAHDERMTDRCIKSFMDQANSGNVLLYADVHGIRSSEDIGILNKADIMPNGDWYTEYRLYDESDDVDDASMQKAEKIWKQMQGLPPYRSPMQKGFSIEGYIPETGILSSMKDEHGNVGQRIIDEVLLDGVVVVPRPAYKDSIANAVYKALGELTPQHIDKISSVAKSEFVKVLNNNATEGEYFKRKWELADALDTAIEKIMKSGHPMVEKSLEVIFDEYKRMAIPLVIKSSSRFQVEESERTSDPYGQAKTSKLELLKAISVELELLSKKL